MANVVLIGLTIDAVLAATSPVHDLVLRTGLLVAGLVLFALGVGLYLGADLGAGPRDGVMTGLHHRFGWSIRLARTAIEVSALVGGIALGGTAGIGTVLFAFAVGPMVQVTLGWFGKPARPEETAPVTGADLGR